MAQSIAQKFSARRGRVGESFSNRFTAGSKKNRLTGRQSLTKEQVAAIYAKAGEVGGAFGPGGFGVVGKGKSRDLNPSKQSFVVVADPASVGSYTAVSIHPYTRKTEHINVYARTKGDVEAQLKARFPNNIDVHQATPIGVTNHDLFEKVPTKQEKELAKAQERKEITIAKRPIMEEIQAMREDSILKVKLDTLAIKDLEGAQRDEALRELRKSRDAADEIDRTFKRLKKEEADRVRKKTEEAENEADKKRKEAEKEAKPKVDAAASRVIKKKEEELRSAQKRLDKVNAENARLKQERESAELRKQQEIDAEMGRNEEKKREAALRKATRSEGSAKGKSSSGPKPLSASIAESSGETFIEKMARLKGQKRVNASQNANEPGAASGGLESVYTTEQLANRKKLIDNITESAAQLYDTDPTLVTRFTEQELSNMGQGDLQAISLELNSRKRKK